MSQDDHPYAAHILDSLHELYDEKYAHAFEWLAHCKPGLSICACEVRQAWLERPSVAQHSLVYVREPKFLIDVPKPYVDVFADNGVSDPHKREMMMDQWHGIANHPYTQVRSYPCSYGGVAELPMKA